MRLIATMAFLLLLDGELIRCFDVNSSCSRGKTISRFRGRQLEELAWSKTTSLNLHNGIDNQCFSKNQRRRIIGTILSVPLSLIIPTRQSSVAAAAGEEVSKTKPFAPIENLLPAVRVKLSIDSATELTRSMVDENSSTTRTTPKSSTEGKALQQLENILLKPQNYVQSTLQLQGVPSKPGDLYLESYKPMKGDLPLQRLLIQNGDVGSWKRLKRAEKNMERSSEIRAALNAYTDALTFSTESYLLNVDKDTRSSMVRQDRLPEMKQVITSDMGMRYLYRNQVLTAMDDVKAELAYQLTLVEKVESFDGNDLLDLLGLAGTAMERWLSLVPPEDLKEALSYNSAAQEQ